MSFNDGEVTIVPFSIEKPVWGNDYWEPTWRGNYKGEEFTITKPPKGHYNYGNGYSVRFKWKGRHPRNDNTEINPQIINQLKLRTMPQVKKLIRTFVDGMNAGKLLDMVMGQPLKFKTFDTCTYCNVWEANKTANTGLHHRSNMFSHNLLDEKGRDGLKSSKYYCKEHTKVAVLEKMIDRGDFEGVDVSIIELGSLKEGGTSAKKQKLKLKHKGIDIDELVPDSDLIQMFNPRQDIFEKRRGVKKNAETFEANDMVKERYFDKQIKKYEDELKWNWLSLNPALTPAIIEKYEDAWDWSDLSINPALTPSLIDKYEDQWSWMYLSFNPALTPALIEKYKDKLDWNFLSDNPALTPALIEKYEDKINWVGISQNPSLTPALIEKYIDKLDWPNLSFNPSLTPALIEKYKDKLDWPMLSFNPALTPSLIEKYKDKLRWAYLSANPSLTPALIEKYEDKWDWFRLAENTALTPALIEKYEDEWNWGFLSKNPALTPAIIEKYEDKWIWEFFSQNPALTPALIEKYKDKLNWEWLSRNPALFGNLHVKKAEDEKIKFKNPLIYGAIIVAIFSYLKS